MNRKETGFWLGVWMLVFAAFGIWMTVSDLKVIRMDSERSYIYTDTITLILLVFIGAVAIRNLWAPRRHDGEEIPQNNLSDTWHVYVSAWKQLWSQKWLRWFFGITFGTRLIGGLIITLLSHYYLTSALKGQTGPFNIFTHKSDWYTLRLLLPNWIITNLPTSPGSFNPIFYISNGPVISLLSTIALLVAAILIYPKLRRLSADVDYVYGARLMKIILAPILVLQLITTVFSLYSFVQLLDKVGKSSFRSNLFFHNPHLNTTVYLDTIISIIVAILSTVLIYIISAGLFAGLVGSLARAKREEQVSLDTFTKDIIRYMKPSSLLYILFSAISIIFFCAYHLFNTLSGDPASIIWYSGISKALKVILYILTMFVPFAMVCGMRGMKQGISRGFRILIVNISEVGAFVALSLTFLTSKELVLKIIDFAIPGGPGVTSKSIATGTVTSAADVLVMAVMLLAVWGLFLRLRGSEEDVNVQEPPVTAAE